VREVKLKTAEDEAFEKIEELAQKRESKDPVERAFAEWPHSHRPEQYFVQREAFHAGWMAAKRGAN